jgi:hydrogenase assembly chaperone HypC/HupF
MCLAIPGKVAELKDGGKTAVIDYGFDQREANNEFLKAKKGEWVLVQFRMAVQKVSEQEALEALKEWNELQ